MVFITGGTGFIGKVLIEKLLRVFGIKRIYLLVRVKNNMTVDERLEHFFQESVKTKQNTKKNYDIQMIQSLYILVTFVHHPNHLDYQHLQKPFC